MRNDIIAGGNWIIDHVKMIASWPAEDTLVSIVDQTSSNGGSPYNILKDLFRLGARFPLEGVGLVGDDANGRMILDDCRRHSIDTTQLFVTPEAATSYTDVMTVLLTGRRTFFHQRGANAHLDAGHFDFTRTQAKHFHLGYLLLLDRLDTLEQGRARAASVLERARASGLTTSVDCVSESGERFRDVIIPTLSCVDVLFANDFEAEKIAGVGLRHKGVIDAASVGQAARKLLRHGVRQWVVIHFPEAVYACSASGEGFWQPGVKVPAAEITGSAGAGDALAAGVLYGLHEDWPMQDSLRLGVCAAALSLSHPTCSEGVRPADVCLEAGKSRGYQPLPA